GDRPGAIPPRRYRAERGADPRLEIDRAFPRRFSADRRDGAVRAVAGRACQRPGRDAVQASSSRYPPAAARAGAEVSVRAVFAAFVLILCGGGSAAAQTADPAAFVRVIYA